MVRRGLVADGLWWVPAGVLPTTDDAKRRLDFIDVFGQSPYAFTMGQNQPALAMDRVGRRRRPRATNCGMHLDGDCSTDDSGRRVFVVAEIDDVPVACGAYRTVDDMTAEIRRMYVAQSARGMRVGAAIVAELEAAREGTGHAAPACWKRGRRQLQASSSSASGIAPGWAEPTLSPASVFLEKTLTA